MFTTMCPKEQQTNDNLIVKNNCFIIKIFDKCSFSGILRGCLTLLALGGGVFHVNFVCLLITFLVLGRLPPNLVTFHNWVLARGNEAGWRMRIFDLFLRISFIHALIVSPPTTLQTGSEIHREPRLRTHTIYMGENFLKSSVQFQTVGRLL